MVYSEIGYIGKQSNVTLSKHAKCAISFISDRKQTGLLSSIMSCVLVATHNLGYYCNYHLTLLPPPAPPHLQQALGTRALNKLPVSLAV